MSRKKPPADPDRLVAAPVVLAPTPYVSLGPLFDSKLVQIGRRAAAAPFVWRGVRMLDVVLAPPGWRDRFTPDDSSYELSMAEAAATPASARLLHVLGVKVWGGELAEFGVYFDVARLTEPQRRMAAAEFSNDSKVQAFVLRAMQSVVEKKKWRCDEVAFRRFLRLAPEAESPS